MQLSGYTYAKISFFFAIVFFNPKFKFSWISRILLTYLSAMSIKAIGPNMVTIVSTERQFTILVTE